MQDGNKHCQRAKDHFLRRLGENLALGRVKVDEDEGAVDVDQRAEVEEGLAHARGGCKGAFFRHNFSEKKSCSREVKVSVTENHISYTQRNCPAASVARTSSR